MGVTRRGKKKERSGVEERRRRKKMEGDGAGGNVPSDQHLVSATS